jgi:opacity protein-like surface antigen
MKKKFLLLVFSTVVFISAACAQDVTGHWTGKVADQYDVVYDFKVDGNTLTGKDTHPDGSVSDISNGKINGDTLSFDVPIQGDLTHVTGKVNGNTITLSLSIQGNDFKLDLKKEGEVK